jgi:hypothetical protein
MAGNQRLMENIVQSNPNHINLLESAKDDLP